MKLSLSQEHQNAGLRKLIDGQERRRRDAALPAHVDNTDRIEDWLGYDDDRRRLASLKAPANAEAMLAKTRAKVEASGQRIAAALAVDTDSLNGIYTGPASVARMRGVG